jgi:hypothetical protein
MLFERPLTILTSEIVDSNNGKVMAQVERKPLRVDETGRGGLGNEYVGFYIAYIEGKRIYAGVSFNNLFKTIEARMKN